MSSLPVIFKHLRQTVVQQPQPQHPLVVIHTGLDQMLNICLHLTQTVKIKGSESLMQVVCVFALSESDAADPLWLKLCPSGVAPLVHINLHEDQVGNYRAFR